MEKALIAATLANFVMFSVAMYMEFRTPQTDNQEQLEELTVNESGWTVTYLSSVNDIDESHYAHMDSRRIMCER